jgi:transcriptional regulator with XRE-family HTH domain
MSVSGEVVRRLRLERGWTQEQLAALAETSVKTIQRVESTGMCGLETRSALASVFEIDLKQLDGEEKIQQARSPSENGTLYFHRVLTGTGLVDIFEGTYWYQFSNEDPRTVQDAETIADAVQTIHDWSEIWGDVDAGSKVKVTFDLGELLKELETKGLWVFGLRLQARFKLPHRDGSSSDLNGDVFNLHIAYADSNRVIVLNPQSSSG